jgi:hypothetical protein
MRFALEIQERSESVEGIEKWGVRKSLFCLTVMEERGSGANHELL